MKTTHSIRGRANNNNLVENNHICPILYMVFTNSSDNRFIGNAMENSRILTSARN